MCPCPEWYADRFSMPRNTFSLNHLASPLPKILNEWPKGIGWAAHSHWIDGPSILDEEPAWIPILKAVASVGWIQAASFLARRCAMRPFSIKMHNRTGGLVLTSGGEAGWLFFLKNSMADISLTYNKCQRMIWRKRLEGDKYPWGHMCPPLHCIWHIPAYYPCAK